MTSAARSAYHRLIDHVELEQVTLDKRDQVGALTELRDQLTRKLATLRGDQRDDSDSE